MVETDIAGTTCVPAAEQQQQAPDTAAAAGEPPGNAAQVKGEGGADVAAQIQAPATDGEAATAAGAAADAQAGGERKKPNPGRKRKVAMHLAYLGAGYHVRWRWDITPALIWYGLHVACQSTGRCSPRLDCQVVRRLVRAVHIISCWLAERAARPFPGLRCQLPSCPTISLSTVCLCKASPGLV